MPLGFFRRALVLGLLSAIGPFAIDMYLPALPAIGRSLNVAPAAVQGSLMAFFVTFGLCQLLIGPLSDMVGRKRPLYAGIALFAAASVACALCSRIETLIAWRAVQGIGACATMVIPRAVVRDLYTGTQAARLMSLLLLVFSVSPLLAPLAGSAAVAWASWRAVFLAVCALALLGLVLSATALEETRPPQSRVGRGWGSAVAAYSTLLRDRRFLGLAFVGGFGVAGFFIYLASSSFVLIEHYGVTPSVYSVYFSINAAAFIGTAQLTGRLTSRYGLPKVVRAAAIGQATTMALLASLWSAGFDSLPLLASLLFVSYGFLGLVIPTTSVLALDEHGPIAGTASALIGAVHMMTGATLVAVASRFMDGTARPLVMGIFMCAAITVGLALVTLGVRTRAEVRVPVV